MKMKTGLVILIICILLIIAGFFIFNNHPAQNQVRVGDISYTLPDGYHVGKVNGNNDTVITNGVDQIFLAVYGKSDVNEYVNNYVDYKKTNNTTVDVKSFEVGEYKVYKSEIPNDANTTHYWFGKNNKVYSIYSFVNNPNRDDITIKLINSISDGQFKLF